jgi:hypothetical protein
MGVANINGFTLHQPWRSNLKGRPQILAEMLGGIQDLMVEQWIGTR